MSPQYPDPSELDADALADTTCHDCGELADTPDDLATYCGLALVCRDCHGAVCTDRWCFEDPDAAPGGHDWLADNDDD